MLLRVYAPCCLLRYVDTSCCRDVAPLIAVDERYAALLRVDGMFVDIRSTNTTTSINESCLWRAALLSYIRATARWRARRGRFTAGDGLAALRAMLVCARRSKGERVKRRMPRYDIIRQRC